RRTPEMLDAAPPAALLEQEAVTHLPIGKVAMTGAERMRRLCAKQPVTKRDETHGVDALLAIAKLKARIAELERRGRSQGQLKVTHSHSGKSPFSEVGKLRAEIGRLKSDIIKLKMMLQEEPDAAKLRKEVVDQ